MERNQEWVGLKEEPLLMKSMTGVLRRDFPTNMGLTGGMGSLQTSSGHLWSTEVLRHCPLNWLNLGATAAYLQSRA